MKLNEIVALASKEDGNGKASKEDILTIKLKLIRDEADKLTREVNKFLRKKRLSEKDRQIINKINGKIGFLASEITRLFTKYREDKE
jgi:hypothetical protein